MKIYSSYCILSSSKFSSPTHFGYSLLANDIILTMSAPVVAIIPKIIVCAVEAQEVPGRAGVRLSHAPHKAVHLVELETKVK